MEAMPFSLLPLLVHFDGLSPDVRTALEAALAAPDDERRHLLERAARKLGRDADLGCRDAAELVGLAPAPCP
jgi:hypothetical protein